MVQTVDESGLVRKGKGRTHNFLSFFDTRLDLRNVPGRVIVGKLLNLILAQHKEVLLGRKLALAKTLAGDALCHGRWSRCLSPWKQRARDSGELVRCRSSAVSWVARGQALSEEARAACAATFATNTGLKYSRYGYQTISRDADIQNIASNGIF